MNPIIYGTTVSTAGSRCATHFRLVEGTVLRTIFRGSKASEKCLGSHFPTSVMVTQQLTLQRLSDHEGYSGFLIHGWQHVPSH